MSPNYTYLTSTGSISTLAFVSLASVISNQNISDSSPEPKRSPGQTAGESARSAAVREEFAARPDKKKKKKGVAIMLLIAETAGFKSYFPLLQISYEQSRKKRVEKKIFDILLCLV